MTEAAPQEPAGADAPGAWLAALPPVSLVPSRPGRYRIRKAPRPSVQLSTIEAMTMALQTLEPDNVQLTRLLEAFDGMVEHQLAIEQRHRRSG